MKNSKKIVSLCIVLLIVVSVMLSACSPAGSGEQASNSAQPATSASASATATAASPSASNSVSAASAESTVSGTKKLKVGFSELAADGAWRIAQIDSMKAEAESRGYDFVMTNAAQSAEKQVSDVEDLLAQGVGFLFISSVDVQAIVPALNAAKDKKVPVILIDREANATPGVDFVTTIISDYLWQGKTCADWVYKKLGDVPINVVEVQGKVGGSDVRDRAQGFRDSMAAHSNMKILASQPADWNRAQAQNVMQNIIQATGGKFNVVYAHNDDMALGCVLALKAAGMKLNHDVYVVTIDGQKEAVQSIINGEISCIVTCSPKFGKAAMDTMESYLKGNKIDSKIVNPETVIDSSNAQQELANAF